MSHLRRAGVVALTLFFVAVFSAFSWSDDATPHSSRVGSSRRHPRADVYELDLREDVAKIRRPDFIMFDDPQWFFAQLDAFFADPQGSVRQRGLDGN